MSKFNIVDKRRRHEVGPIKTAPTPTGHTYNGAPGYEYETVSQLFLLGCANMVAEDTFYENGKVRDQRYLSLIRLAVDEGHSDWLKRFFPWLRNEANMRSAAIIGAVEAARAMVTRKIPGSRPMIRAVLTRADEPGEMVAYHMANYGRVMPKPIKRGIADAVARLYTQRNALKYDTDSKGVRFGDVLELTHAAPVSPEQIDLFGWLVTRGKKRREVAIPDSLTMIVANEALRRQAASTPQLLLHSARLRHAGMTWEAARSLAGRHVSARDMWQALIPNMGYMALLRNLRNFDQAGIGSDSIEYVLRKLTDPDEVRESRQLPMRFLSAYRESPSHNWSRALETALDLSLRSIPQFSGRTLVLIDTSGSMHNPFSGKSTLMRWDAAAIFGLAVAARCENADVVSFATGSQVFPARRGETLLKGLDRFRTGGFFLNGGTDTTAAVTRNFRGHDRVIILTDEQADGDLRYGRDVLSAVPATVPAITFNLAGYRMGQAAAGSRNRITIGGLSDAAFQLLPALEHRARGGWPF